MDDDPQNPSWLRDAESGSKPSKPTENTGLVRGGPRGGGAPSPPHGGAAGGGEPPGGRAGGGGSDDGAGDEGGGAHHGHGAMDERDRGSSDHDARHPERGPLLNFFFLVSNLTLASALSVAAAQVLNLTAYFASENEHNLTIQQVGWSVGAATPNPPFPFPAIDARGRGGAPGARGRVVSVVRGRDDMTARAAARR